MASWSAARPQRGLSVRLQGCCPRSCRLLKQAILLCPPEHHAGPGTHEGCQQEPGQPNLPSSGGSLPTLSEINGGVPPGANLILWAGPGCHMGQVESHWATDLHARSLVFAAQPKYAIRLMRSSGAWPFHVVRGASTCMMLFWSCSTAIAHHIV